MSSTKLKQTKKSTEEIVLQEDYSQLISRCNEISIPLVPEKLHKSVLKLVKKASRKQSLCRGVKEVLKAIRKKQKGCVIIAGDIYPIDVVSHLPILCEEKEISYCFVPSKLQLGNASLTKRPTSCLMIKEHEDYRKRYESITKEFRSLNEYI